MTHKNPDKRRARGEASRERILREAIGLMAEEGYGSLSVAAVSRRAGVSVTSLYHHFGDKAGLVDAAISTALAEASTGFFTSIQDTSSRLAHLDRFVGLVAAMVENRDPNLSLVAMAIATPGPYPDGLGETLRLARKAVLETVSTDFARYLGVADASLLAQLFAAFAGQAYNWSRGGEMPVTDTISSLRTMVLLMCAELQPDLLDDAEFRDEVLRVRAEIARPRL